MSDKLKEKWDRYLDTLSPEIRQLVVKYVSCTQLSTWDGDLYYKDSESEFEPKSECLYAFFGASPDSTTGEYWIVFDGIHTGDVIAMYGLSSILCYIRVGNVDELPKIIKEHEIPIP